MSRSLTNWDVFWTNKIQMRQIVVGRLQVPLGPQLMLGLYSLSVLESCMKRCLYLFLCMAMRQCYVRIRAVQTDYLRGLLSIRSVDKVSNARIRELCGMTKG